MKNRGKEPASVAQAMNLLERSRQATKARENTMKAGKWTLLALLGLMALVGVGTVPAMHVVPVVAVAVTLLAIQAVIVPLAKWRADDAKEDTETTVRALLHSDK